LFATNQPLAIRFVGNDLASADQLAKQRHRQTSQERGFAETVTELARHACQALFAADSGFVSTDAADDSGKEGIDRAWRGWVGGMGIVVG